MNEIIKNDMLLPSINYHIWKPCNMNCKFCFASFEDVKNVLPKGHLSRNESLELIDKIIDAGFTKITFAGGEPTLCNWLPELIERAKVGGMATMIVTNGFFLTDRYLQKLEGLLDWITISIDSVLPETNFLSGRYTRQTIPDKNYYNEAVFKIKKYGFRLKINTVISKLNWQEKIDEFIIRANPERWKIFQVLPIVGQNDKYIEDFIITPKQFNFFQHNHKYVENIGIDVIFESNNDMIGSYLMIDPAGRFYDNVNESYFYSSPILEVGVVKAFKQINVDYQKFIKRQGIYNWKLKKNEM